MLAILFIGSLRLLNLIVSPLCAKSALNLKQKAEKTLIPFLRAAQLPRPTKDFACRDGVLVNFGFWIIVLPLAHKASLANQFHLQFAYVTLRFRNILALQKQDYFLNNGINENKELKSASVSGVLPLNLSSICISFSFSRIRMNILIYP